ncbi:DNA polymerase III subunit delta' [Caryophanon tenue]|uniref:DNA polymerase III subunit delta' n=1 Tax=Caryophanon tenue TaxID=33978 RepID=A0A1C0YCE3_9BACL|nr:DNA polymerase III subunit delta' [Caryophanon tenue]OCS84842.1 DNA polymerase III subunit delta' [Caryophanon tenue]
MTRTIEQLKTIQPVVIKQLQTIIEKNRTAHAYIFDGEQGTGKREVAHFFAKLLLCDNIIHNVPCETCRQCIRIESGNHPNVVEIMPDGAFIKIEQVRELLAEMKKKGMEEGRKIYILHDADRLNVGAANTLLKYLEEPDGVVTAILVTAQLQSILPTIRSRCQHIKFQKMPRAVLIEKLLAAGVTQSMASTVSMVTNELETAIALSQDEQFASARKTVLKLVEAVQKNVHEALLIVHEDWLPSFKEKSDMEQALDLLLFAYRDIVAYKANPDAAFTYPDLLPLLREVSLQTTYEQLSNQLQAILHTRSNLQRNMNRALMMEQLMLNLQEG